jgi:peptide/nickel transport system substrate-binding protein
VRRTGTIAAVVLAAVVAAGGGSGAQRAGSLVVAAAADGYFSTPNFPTVAKYPTNASVFESLVRVTPLYRVRPWLATRWRFIPPNTWRFTLRRGVRFHNGAPFDAEAVKYTMDTIAAARTGRGIGIDDKAVIRVVDRFTVDITPSFPNRRLVQQLTHPQRSIIAPGSSLERPVGTGPFRFVSYTRNQQLVVERWDGYWGPKAKLDRITFRFIPDANARALALQSGAVQVAADIPRETTRTIERNTNLRVARSTVGAYEALYFALRAAPGYELGANRAIRRAFPMAINRSVIIRNVWQGNAKLIKTMIPPAVLGKYAREIKGPTYNPRLARRILQQDGWTVGPDGIRQRAGRRLELTMVVGFPNADSHGSLAEAIQAMVRQVGIDLKIVKAPDGPAYVRAQQRGEGSLFAEIGNQNDANPCFLPDLLFYFKGKEHADYGYRFGPGGRFDQIIDRQCREGVTIADAERGAAAAMNQLIDKTHVVVPIAGVFRLYGLSKQVRGFVPHPSQTNQGWATVSLAR